MAELQRLAASASPAEICKALDEDGALIVEGLITPNDLDRLKTEVMPYVEATSVGKDAFTGFHTTRTGALVARSPACRDLVMAGSVLGAARQFLEPYCETIQLHLTQLIRIMPGQPVQPLHRDRLAWGGYLPPSIEPQFNTIWAVTDFTKENGATQVVPGSHKWDPKRQPEEGEITWAEMKAGSVLVYSGTVIHGGGANTSKADRMGLNITYTLGWLRQEENQFLSCPPEIAKDLDPELRELLGYAMGSYALGYFTPPLPPGEGPEIVPPNVMFGGKDESWGQGHYEAVTKRAADGGM